jgi:hypothetical protein
MKLVYKFYDVENHRAISDEVYSYVTEHTEILKPRNPIFFNDVDVFSMLKYTPLLAEFLQQQSLIPKQISVVVVPSDMDPYLHVDTIDPYVRLLWPVKNCIGARTKFYDVPRECLKLEHNIMGSSNIYYNITEQQEWASLGEIELTQPVIFDASVAHEVHPAPDATEPRISFTMGFDRDLPISKSVKAWFGFNR